MRNNINMHITKFMISAHKYKKIDKMKKIKT